VTVIHRGQQYLLPHGPYPAGQAKAGAPAASS
jgi:hypothetical protein